MAAKPRIAVVGAGNLGTALAVSLRDAGYKIEAVIARSGGASRSSAAKLARRVGAKVSSDPADRTGADVLWFCVPDVEIAPAAKSFAAGKGWTGKVALHSSGALTSDELAVLRARGAAVASVHPLMTFVSNSRPSLMGVPFAIEGDAAAVRVARRIVRDLGGQAYPIHKKDKAAYHTWATFASPLFTALLAATERVAFLARVNRKEARKRMLPIVVQTLVNYAALGAPAGFSGPIIRGDVDTVQRHLGVLRKLPVAREVYVALACAALELLPARNRRALRVALRGAGK